VTDLPREQSGELGPEGTRISTQQEPGDNLEDGLLGWALVLCGAWIPGRVGSLTRLR
jgi:hypothetical protein